MKARQPGRRRQAAARVSTVTAALLFALSVIFTFINARIFLGEDLTPDMIIGGVLIVAAVSFHGSTRRNPEVAPLKTELIRPEVESPRDACPTRIG